MKVVSLHSDDECGMKEMSLIPMTITNFAEQDLHYSDITASTAIKQSDNTSQHNQLIKITVIVSSLSRAVSLPVVWRGLPFQSCVYRIMFPRN